MKALLGILMCLVLGAAPVFAIDGGPDYGTSRVTTTGIYAGLLRPTVDPNSLGIFTITVPKKGIGTGTVAVFRNGNYYPGTFQGIADPDSAKMTGVVQGTFTRTVGQVVTNGSSTSTITFVYTYQVNGSVKARIKPNPDPYSTSTVRLRGQSELTYQNDEGNPSGDSGGPISYVVNGFKQSEI